MERLGQDGLQIEDLERIVEREKLLIESDDLAQLRASAEAIRDHPWSPEMEAIIEGTKDELAVMAAMGRISQEERLRLMQILDEALPDYPVFPIRFPAPDEPDRAA